MSASPHPCMFALVSLWQSLLSWAWKSLQKVTAAMKLRYLLLGRKAVTNLDSILKSRDTTLLTKVHIAKDMVFPVVRYRCESWTIKKAAAKSLQLSPTLCDPIDGSPPGSPVPGILQARTLLPFKKAESQRIDAFKLWCWRRLLKVRWLESPLDCKEIKPVNPKEINPEYSLEGLMLNLKFQYYGHLMPRADSLEKTLMLGKNVSRIRGQQKMKWLDSITDSTDMILSKFRETVEDRSSSWRHKDSDMT